MDLSVVGGDVFHVDGLVVSAGQQRCPRGRTHRARTEMVEPQAIASDGIYVRGVDFGANGAQIGEANIIQDQENNIRAARCGHWAG